MNESPNLFFWEADFVFHGSLEYEFEIAFLGPLDRYEQLVQFVVDEPTQVFNDVRVVQRLKKGMVIQ